MASNRHLGRIVALQTLYEYEFRKQSEDTSANIDEILAFSDEIILKKGFGFSDKEVALANRIWKKLS